jgi:two-component system alkaline phosphatase synthesis response regulator PhoP
LTAGDSNAKNIVMSQQKKILLVDDEKESLFYLGNFLRRKDYDVVTAEDGKTAIEIAKSQKPDLIILDIVMPEMDGGASSRNSLPRPYYC